MESKKILSVLLSSSMLLSTSITAISTSDIDSTSFDKAVIKTNISHQNTSSGTCGDNVTWMLDDYGTFTVMGMGDMKNYSSPEDVPWYEERLNIKNVTIQSGVTSIGAYSFAECENLSSVKIADTVAKIENYAFYFCVFLVSVTIPSSVTDIGISAFNSCMHLPSVTIPDSVINIGNYAFSNCYSLEYINVNQANQYYASDSAGVLFDKNKTKLLLYPNRASNIASEYKIPNGVESIATGAFKDCQNLQYLTIPKSVVEIEDYAFGDDSLFSAVYFGGSEEEWDKIEIGAYNYSLLNAHITYDVNTNTVINSGTCGQGAIWALYDDGTLEISGWGDMTDYSAYSAAPWFSSRSSIKKIVIGEEITSVGNYSFYCLQNITSVTIPRDVTRIGVSAFHNCSSLKSVSIPYGAMYIDDFAFAWCVNLTSITLPNMLYSIGEYAFNGCIAIATVTIPEGVRDIKRNAFYSCSGLESVTIPYNVSSIGDFAFGGCQKLTSITVDENNEYYSNDEYGVLFDKNKETLIQYVTGNEIASYIIPDSVINIADSAFKNAQYLKHVTIPDSVAIIADNAFRACSSLENINVGEKNSNYSNDEYGVLFDKNKTKLIQYPICCETTSYVIQNSVKEIAPHAFEYCSSLVSVTLPDMLSSIGEYAFYYCSALKSIDIPNSVNSIGEYAFYNCSNIEYMIITDGIATIDNYTFGYCSKLIAVMIPQSVKTILRGAFSNCTSLSYVYYTGSAETWSSVAINVYNEPLINAIMYFDFDDSSIPEITEDSKYRIDEESLCVVAKSASKNGESLEKFMANIATDKKFIRVVDASGEVKTEVTKLTTGYKLQLLGDDGGVVKTYTIIMLGDIDRNGRYTISDVSGVQSAVFEKPEKGSVEYIEANVDGNARLSVTDASALQSFIANGEW